MNTVSQFMVNFVIPTEIPQDFLELLPYQEMVVDRYLEEGKLINYALSMDRRQLWAIFNANSEMEVLEMIIDFPLTEFMKVEISPLTQFQTTDFPFLKFSMN